MASKKKEGSNAALTSLYSELNTLGQEDDYEKIIKVSNKSKYVRLCFLTKTCLMLFVFPLFMENDQPQIISDLPFVTNSVFFMLNFLTKVWKVLFMIIFFLILLVLLVFEFF